MKFVLVVFCALVMGVCASDNTKNGVVRFTAEYWENQFGWFKLNVEIEKDKLIGSLSRPSGQNKKDRLQQMQNEKMADLERKIASLNASIEKSVPSSFKVAMKGCWSGAYAYTIPAVVAAAIPAVVAAVSEAIEVVCNIHDANTSK